jgi:hypothetical protein
MALIHQFTQHSCSVWFNIRRGIWREKLQSPWLTNKYRKMLFPEYYPLRLKKIIFKSTCLFCLGGNMQTRSTKAMKPEWVEREMCKNTTRPIAAAVRTTGSALKKTFRGMNGNTPSNSWHRNRAAEDQYQHLVLHYCQ